MTEILVCPTSGHGSRVRNPLAARFHLWTVTALHCTEHMFTIPLLRFTEILWEWILIPNHPFMYIKMQNVNFLDVSYTYYTHFRWNVHCSNILHVTTEYLQTNSGRLFIGFRNIGISKKPEYWLPVYVKCLMRQRVFSRLCANWTEQLIADYSIIIR